MGWNATLKNFLIYESFDMESYPLKYLCIVKMSHFQQFNDWSRKLEDL